MPVAPEQESRDSLIRAVRFRSTVLDDFAKDFSRPERINAALIRIYHELGISDKTLYQPRYPGLTRYLWMFDSSRHALRKLMLFFPSSVPAAQPLESISNEFSNLCAELPSPKALEDLSSEELENWDDDDSLITVQENAYDAYIGTLAQVAWFQEAARYSSFPSCSLDVPIMLLITIRDLRTTGVHMVWNLRSDDEAAPLSLVDKDPKPDDDNDDDLEPPPLMQGVVRQEHSESVDKLSNSCPLCFPNHDCGRTSPGL